MPWRRDVALPQFASTSKSGGHHDFDSRTAFHPDGAGSLRRRISIRARGDLDIARAKIKPRLYHACAKEVELQAHFTENPQEGEGIAGLSGSGNPVRIRLIYCRGPVGEFSGAGSANAGDRTN